MDNEQRILHTWHCNASPWTEAVRAGVIESRRLVTDQAILNAVMSLAPASMLDLGCGEGWLARAVAEQGISVLGVDAVPELVDQARQSSHAKFAVHSYAEVAAGHLAWQGDLVVCNFSLLGDDSVVSLLRAIPGLLNTGGALVIQTLHPLMACGDEPYRDGWRETSWAGCGEGFSDPAPWYFRTLESWCALLQDAGFYPPEIHEPLHPTTGRPASLLMICKPLIF